MNKSRLSYAVCAVLLTFIPLSANAASILFGAPTDRGSCSELRRSDCSRNISVNQQVDVFPIGTLPGFIVRGQASANSNITGAATADLRVTYDIPYSISRNVNVTPGPGGALASFESFQLEFIADYVGIFWVVDDFGQIGGAQSARAFDASITSLGGFFSGVSLPGDSFSGDKNTPTFWGGTFSDRRILDFTPGLNESGPRQSESDTDAQGIPTDFRAWDDFLGPQVQDYSQPFNVTQTFDDVLRVSFRLTADSRATSGLFSVDGGGAVACAGLGSSLGGNLINGVTDTDCDLAGLFVGVDITSRGTYQTVVGAVPIPAAVWLFGSGLLGLVGMARRKKVA